MTQRSFYDRTRAKMSKASNSYRAKENTNDLPGLSYEQGHSIKNIFTPRALFPIIGRDGYKTVLTYRVHDGSSNNRTIFQTEDTSENNYFVETDRLIPSRFVIRRDSINLITRGNYKDYIKGINLPNGTTIEFQN